MEVFRTFILILLSVFLIIHSYAQRTIDEYAKKNFKFNKKVRTESNVNSKGFESTATISANCKTLFFASHREGVIGRKDIYMRAELTNEDRNLSQNLDKKTNTKYDENFPNLFYDGKTLHISSRGLNSMGGYDYFKYTWDREKNKWSKAENLGYPINTTRDDICISFTEDIKDAILIITNNRTQEKRQYVLNSKYGILLIPLLSGSYTFMIDASRYAPLDKKLIIKRESDFIPFISKEFTLIK